MTTLNFGPIGYGCWRFATNTIQDADRLIRTALDHDMVLIDTADIYGLDSPKGFGGAEAVLGEVLSASPTLRDRMTLATKGGIIPPRPYNSSQAYLIEALESSLRRLKVDHIDLYQIHRPDLTTPISDLARTLDMMVQSGKVGAIGVSNFTISQMRALSTHLNAPITTIQPEFSPLNQTALNDGTFDYAEEINASILAWSPLGGGALFVEDGPVQNCVGKIARDTGFTATQIALAFTRGLGADVIPLIGTQRESRIKDAAKAAHLTLSARHIYDIVEAKRGTAMP